MPGARKFVQEPFSDDSDVDSDGKGSSVLDPELDGGRSDSGDSEIGDGASEATSSSNEGEGVAQYIGEDDLSDGGSGEAENYDEDEEAELKRMQKAKAQSSLSKGKGKGRVLDSDGSDDSEEEYTDVSDLQDEEEDEFEADRQAKLAEVKARLAEIRDAKGGGNRTRRGSEPEGRAEDGIHKEVQEKGEKGDGREKKRRASKNAPIQLPAKKPVSRKRKIVDIPASTVRDPRFSSLSGKFSEEQFHKRYASVLPEMLRSELDSLKKTHARLKHLEKNGMRGAKEEREKVEAALRRAESKENARKSKQIEEEVKEKLKAEELKKRKEGKKAFWLKKSDIRQAVLRDKFDRLSGAAASTSASTDTGEQQQPKGDPKALRKAIERRRKKNSQKERRGMPTVPGDGGTGGGGPRPKRFSGQDGASGLKAGAGGGKRKRGRRG